MFGIGFSEMLVLAVIALLVFGPRRLPEIGNAVGKGLKEFKDAVNSTESVKTVSVSEKKPEEVIVEADEAKK